MQIVMSWLSTSPVLNQALFSFSYWMIVACQLLLLLSIHPCKDITQSGYFLPEIHTMSSSPQLQPGMAVSKHFESWMEGATAEFFDKLASIKQPVAGNRFICRVGLKDVFFIEYGDHESLLQALVSTPPIWIITPHKW